MRHTVLASFASLPLLLAATAGTAAAQAAPGACECPPPAAPVVMAAAAPELPRWSIGLDLSGTSLKAKDADPSADPTQYSGGGLEVGYRLFPRWELGLAIEGAREQNADGTPGDHELRRSLLTARFHLDPYARWDFYGVAGLGSAAIVDAGTTGAVPSDQMRATAELGVGVERRWGHLGVSAELLGVGVSPTQADSQPASAQPTGAAAAAATATPTPPPTTTSSDPGLGGAELRVGIAYHF